MPERSQPLGGKAAAPLLQARGLSFDAGGRRLVDGVDLAIRAGRCTVIMGPNGAGKSLLLRLLHGLLAPVAGEIRWRGGALDRAARREQAMVFQRPVLLRRSVAANLRFALAARGVRGGERRRRQAAALALARLAGQAGQPARLLSVGEQQRLAVARALAGAPRILLLDEPTASLDPASTLAIEELVRQAQGEGVTPLWVTHDIGQARRLGQELVFLEAGRVAEAGALAERLAAPRSPALQAWLQGWLPVAPPRRQAG